MGSLSSPPPGSLKMLLLMLPVMLGLPLFARELNLLSLGDETSYHLGLDVKKARAILLVCASLITGVCVALSGIIAFIGLVIPHAMRAAAGPPDHHYVIPSSMLAGGGFFHLLRHHLPGHHQALELPVGGHHWS
jgi:iron complex transport system permease protein